MGILLHTIAVLFGIFGTFIYFRSIVRVMLLNGRESDIIERGARRLAVKFMQGLARNKREYEEIQPRQAWVMPIFIFLAVAIWFLLVQFSFSLVLWGLRVEPGWPRAFSASGSALSTLGFLTPNTLLGEYLAIYEAAIGLAIVVMIFTFVPGYQTSIQVRERKVGWLVARTGSHPTSLSMLAALKKAGRANDSVVWENWEGWFRGIQETHLITPILAYVPSVYRGTNWVETSAAVLNTASLILSALDNQNSEAVRLCREAGISTLRLIATVLHEGQLPEAPPWRPVDTELIARFDQIYIQLVETGLPVKSDKEQCRAAFVNYVAEYETSLRHISASTLMPFEEPWSLSHTQPTSARNSA